VIYKDGLLKMILFTNLENVRINTKWYNSIPILKLTTGDKFIMETLNKPRQKLLTLLQKEASMNNFKIMINKNIL